MVIPFESGVENVKPVKLSDIAEKVAFVPLETTDTSLVARQMLSQIRLANGCIYVPCSEGLLTFDEKTGKFLRRISRKGQGPGEYTSIRGIEILEGSEYVYLFSGEKVLTFQSDGKFLTQYSKPGGWATSIIQDSLCLSFIINHTGQQEYRLLITDERADTLQRFPQYDRFEVPGGFNWLYHHTLERYLYTHKDEHNTCKDGGDKQTVHSLGSHNARHDGGECRRGARDLDAAAAEQGYAESRGDGGVDTAGGLYAGGQRQRDGQGQGDDGNDHTRHQVGHQLGGGVALEGGEKLGREEFHSDVSPIEKSERQYRTAMPCGTTEYGKNQNSPEILPSSSTSIFSAAGALGRPGMVMMSPVRATIKPAPAETFRLRTVTVKPSGAPRSF
mgnify:CR=1 FL=1